MSVVRTVVSAVLALFIVMQPAQSTPPERASFVHKDWQLACDNTRTCRAAGYQNRDDELAVSVLLTRIAGPDQAVSGEVMIGQYFESEAVDSLPPEFQISLRIDERDAGSVTMTKESLLADMSAAQVTALLDALTRDSVIEWTAGGQSWALSDSGSTAVLLKMDEFQGRLGTADALIKKGTRDESQVLPPLPVPTITVPALAEAQDGDDQFAAGQTATLLTALRDTLENEYECSLLFEADADNPMLKVLRLTNSKVLVSTACNAGAYSFTTGYWVVADKNPSAAKLITAAGSDYFSGSIHANYKGRGLGDCWSLNSWAWDGEQFVHANSSSTGLCRGLAPGGAWSLPTLIGNVVLADAD